MSNTKETKKVADPAAELRAKRQAAREKAKQELAETPDLTELLEHSDVVDENLAGIEADEELAYAQRIVVQAHDEGKAPKKPAPKNQTKVETQAKTAAANPWGNQQQ